MNPLTLKRLGIAILGGMAAVWALAVVAASTGEVTLDRFHSLGAAIWLLPVVAGASVGVAAWLVLSALPEDLTADDRPAQHACPTCGKAIRDDWRLCPYCGNLVDAETTVRQRVPV